MTPSGEQWFLDWLIRTDRPHPALTVPLGDDAAVWRLGSGEQIVLAADAIAEGTHFARGEDPVLVGRKALAINLSDLAAMGASPLCSLATAAFPHGFSGDLATAMTRGLRDAGTKYGCPLVGGDTVAHDGGIVLSVSVVGTLLPGGPVTRRGARPGDLIAVTGALGGSLLGRHLRFEPRIPESRRLLQLGPPSAMMDVSDGLLLDLFRLADASGVGFIVDGDRVPVHADARAAGGDARRRALGADGEDFELLLTAPAETLRHIVASWDLPTPVTIIGEVLPSSRILVLDGRESVASPLGYEHG